MKTSQNGSAPEIRTHLPGVTAEGLEQIKACINLWAAVVKQTVADAMRAEIPEQRILELEAAAEGPAATLEAEKQAYRIALVSNTRRRAAHRWLASDKCEVGSLVWICQVANLDPGAIRRRVAA